jgi:Xaa-Pro aminopeptidase
VPWSFLAASGPVASSFVASALPPWNPTYRYRAGDALHVDAYGVVDGYAYDFGRTVIVGGRGAAAQQRVIDGVRGAVAAVAARIEPGVSCRTLYETGIAYLATAGLTPAAGSFGHALGAGFFPPYVTPQDPRADHPLAPSRGIAIEVSARDDDGHYAFHEDNFVLLADGVRCLTSGV